MKTGKINRSKLLKRFWLIANSIGKENAYDVVELLYKKRSLSSLSPAELEKVVRILVEKSGFVFQSKKEIEFQTPLKSQRQKRRFFVFPCNFFDDLGLIADISTPLKRKIQVMVYESGVSTNFIKSLVKKMAVGNYFGITSAQKVIEALKNIKITGWKENGQPQRKKQSINKNKEKKEVKPPEPNPVKLPPSVPYWEHPEKIVNKGNKRYLIDVFWRMDKAGHDYVVKPK